MKYNHREEQLYPLLYDEVKDKLPEERKVEVTRDTPLPELVEILHTLEPEMVKLVGQNNIKCEKQQHCKMSPTKSEEQVSNTSSGNSPSIQRMPTSDWRIDRRSRIDELASNDHSVAMIAYISWARSLIEVPIE